MHNFTQTSPDPYIKTSNGVYIPRAMLKIQPETAPARPDGEPQQLLVSGESRQQRRARERQLADASRAYLAKQQADADKRRKLQAVQGAQTAAKK